MTWISAQEKVKKRPNLSVLALTAFIASFVIARIFTTLSPETVLVRGGIHIHHYWYGIILLAVGGWIAISYENERIDRIAAILFGAGGGLIGDEFGLLLYMDNKSYWGGITYTFATVFVTTASTLILVNRYWNIISPEFAQFIRSGASLYVGAFLLALSLWFLLWIENLIVMIVSSVTTILACIFIVFYFVQRARLSRTFH